LGFIDRYAKAGTRPGSGTRLGFAGCIGAFGKISSSELSP
jgi:hypothetical protein